MDVEIKFLLDCLRCLKGNISSFSQKGCCARRFSDDSDEESGLLIMKSYDIKENLLTA